MSAQKRPSRSRPYDASSLDAAKGFASPKRLCIASSNTAVKASPRTSAAIRVRKPKLEAFLAPPASSSSTSSESEDSVHEVLEDGSAKVEGTKGDTLNQSPNGIASEAVTGTNSLHVQDAASTAVIDDSMLSMDEEDELAAASLQETPSVRSKMKRVVLETLSDDDSEMQGSPSRRASARHASARHSPLAEKSAPVSVRRATPRKTNTKQAQVLPVSTADSEDGSDIDATALITPSKSRILPVETPSRSSKRLDKVFEKVAKKLEDTAVPLLRPCAEQIYQLKAEILAKVNGKTALPLREVEKPYESIHSLLRETIIRAESNSALLLGPPASGKSLLLQTVLSAFRKAKDAFITVHLDGNIHTDDKMALRALARQLQPDSDQDTIANADMMTALLAILSHPSEFGEDGQALSIVLVLDHFERFTQHHRQVLLYNLFDIAQSKKAPVCVIGLTTQVDAFDMLEKRVKSRFSHRIIQMAPPSTLEDFKALCLSGLTCTGQERQLSPYESAWNEYMEENLALDRFIAYVFYTAKDPRHVFARLALPIAQQIGEAQPFLDFAKISPSLDALPSVMPLSQGKNDLVAGCSMLELALLICSCRLDVKQQKNSFATCYDEYATLAHRTSTTQRAEGIVNIRVWSKKLARGAWARLEEAGLVVPVFAKTAAMTGGSEFAAVRCEVHLMSLQVLLKDSTLIKQAMKAWLRL